MKILVTDANQRTALFVIRALGAAGHEVRACEKREYAKALGFASKFCAEAKVLDAIRPDLLLKAAKDCDAIFPVASNTIHCVLQNAALFKNFFQLLPSLESFNLANDKAELLGVAAEAGIALPNTHDIQSIDDIDRLAGDFKFPCVIKLKNDVELYLPPKERYSIVRDLSSLKREYARLSAIKDKPLVQDLIFGDGYGASFLIGPEGKTYARFAHRRLREYPASGGPSTLLVSFHDNDLLQQAELLLKKLNWRGIAMVEFKKDREDGKFKLMEINPRIWGGAELPIRLGMNFPALCMDLACGRFTERKLNYPAGKKMRFLATDILAFTGYLKAGKFGKASGFLTDLINPFILPGIWRFDDPKPFFTYFSR